MRKSKWTMRVAREGVMAIKVPALDPRLREDPPRGLGPGQLGNVFEGAGHERLPVLRGNHSLQIDLVLGFVPNWN